MRTLSYSRKLSRGKLLIIVLTMFCIFRKGKLYLVFEFVDKTLLEILEERTTGLPGNLVRQYIF